MRSDERATTPDKPAQRRPVRQRQLAARVGEDHRIRASKPPRRELDGALAQKDHVVARASLPEAREERRGRRDGLVDEAARFVAAMTTRQIGVALRLRPTRRR
jgi:hypothetical protein